MTKRAFGELELSVLQTLRQGEKMTVSDVHRALGGTDKYTTIMTVMNRLVKKNQLEREREGLRYTYWIVEAKSHVPSLLKKKMFGFKASEIVSYLIDAADDVSEAELEQMQQMIEEAKQKRRRES
ncbi:MAG: hypothetical protein S4CHLAM2_01220 [Chlamydiales bacterium]|nr:hypothetical protein [Chlamydiales bacterium]